MKDLTATHTHTHTHTNNIMFVSKEFKRTRNMFPKLKIK